MLGIDRTPKLFDIARKVNLELWSNQVTPSHFLINHFVVFGHISGFRHTEYSTAEQIWNIQENTEYSTAEQKFSTEYRIESEAGYSDNPCKLLSDLFIYCKVKSNVIMKLSFLNYNHYEKKTFILLSISHKPFDILVITRLPVQYYSIRIATKNVC